MLKIKNFLFVLFIPVLVRAQTDILIGGRSTDIDKYAGFLMSDWNIPGLAIVIVHKDKVLFSRGYGYADVQTRRQMDPSTLFPIASNTKLFTAILAAQLEAEGRLDLDVPVNRYIPGLKFHSDELSSRVTMRDLLSHRTGLPSYDGVWISAGFERQELLSKLAYMKPALGFREGYIYNNNMYTTAGIVIERITGKSWEENVRTRLFQPLEMNNSGFTGVGPIPALLSKSYFETQGAELKPRLTSSQSAALGPAGTIYSNLNDMANWMIALINNGKFKGKQVVAESAVAETMIPNSISDKRGRYEELSNSIYAMGRSLQTYKGTKMVSHTGSIDGFYSNLTYLPHDSIAIFAIHNATSAGSLRSVLNLPLIDILKGREQTDWSGRYRKDYLEARAREMSEDRTNQPVANTSPSHQLTAYAGVYQHPVYGKIEIRSTAGKLQVSFRNINTELAHWHYDQFNTVDDGRGAYQLRVNFLTDQKGNISKILLRPFGDPETEFIRQ